VSLLKGGAPAFVAMERPLLGGVEAEWPRYFTVELTSTLCRQAGEFAERYRLRAYDSVHLAAFAEVARESGVRDTRFWSFDHALNRAARSLRRTLTRAR
jgi:predicted nucleic acid-binding protein